MVAAETSLPLVRPMLATLGEAPTAPGWGFEFKWDGVRDLFYVEDRRLWILSRNDRDVTAAYPELRPVADRLPGPAGHPHARPGPAPAFAAPRHPAVRRTGPAGASPGGDMGRTATHRRGHPPHPDAGDDQRWSLQDQLTQRRDASVDEWEAEGA